MAQSSPEASVIKAYWQPGCTSCLRMKEFLTEHGVPFASVNVLEDRDAFAELAMLGPFSCRWSLLNGEAPCPT